MFLNLTNHPLSAWPREQKEAAEKYGEIVDLPFPAVDPALSTEEVYSMAKETAEKVYALDPDCVLCQGEFTLTYALVQLLSKKHIKTVAACSERVTEEKNENGEIIKKIVFKFRGFREYIR